MIRLVRPEDAEGIADIYNYYVEKSVATFEEDPVDANSMLSRIDSVRRDWPWFVFHDSGDLKGYAYASRWKARSAYRFTVETTVYVKQGESGRGTGSMLYNSLIEGLRSLNVHALIAGISLPNEPSIALHEKFGFRKVAQFPELGFKFGEWIDVGYWQLLLNHDSESRKALSH